MFYDCPTCNFPAEIVERWIMESTDGPIEHVFIRCPEGHWFKCSVEFLERKGGAA
jgi:hypothetical protein